MQGIQPVEFLAGKRMILVVCGAIVLLGLLEVFINALAILIELSDTVECVREAARLIGFNYNIRLPMFFSTATPPSKNVQIVLSTSGS